MRSSPAMKIREQFLAHAEAVDGKRPSCGKQLHNRRIGAGVDGRESL